MSNPSPTVIGYADDLALVLIDIYGAQGAGLSLFVVMLPQATAMRINFSKTKVLPLHRALSVHAIEALALHHDDWRLASECSRVLYLGVWVGHDAHVQRFSAVIEKMEARVARIDALRLGFPAALGLSRIVLWAIVHHYLSLYAPDDCLRRAFNKVYSFLVRGPPKWLPYGVAIHMRQWGWKVAPPSLDALSCRLKLFCLIRLGHVNFPALWQRMYDAHLDLEASLLPISRDWMFRSSVAALHDLERLAVLGNLVARDDDRLVMRSRLREVIPKPKAREKLLLAWLSSDSMPLAHGREALNAWLARRIAWNSEWDSHRMLVRLTTLLVRVAKLSPLRHTNAVLRIITQGIVLNTKESGDHGCILSKTCGGNNTHGHYVGSACWCSPRLGRRFHGLIPVSRSLVRQRLDD